MSIHSVVARHHGHKHVVLSPVVIALAALAAPASAAVVWDESVQGDLSTNPAAPTAIAVALGGSTVMGTMGSPNDTRDVFTFTIAAGQQLTAIHLLDYRDLATGGLGNRGFIHIDDGATTVVPSAATILEFLGGSHLDRVLFPLTTDNVLAAMAGAPAGGVGFTAPLGPGAYTINVQQTGTQMTGYSLELVVTPAPGVVPILALGGLVTLRRRR